MDPKDCAERFPDDPSIPDQVQLLRRIPQKHLIHDANPERVRPTSAAFDDDDDLSPMSVCLANILAAEGRRPEAVLVGHPNFALAALTAGLVRAHRQTDLPPCFEAEFSAEIECSVKVGGVRGG